MAKGYKRKTIRNLNDLQNEQDRIRDMYEDMERHIYDSIFSPKTMLTLALSAFSARKKKKKSRKLKQSLYIANPSAAQKPSTSLFKKILSSKFVKHSAKSWLKWQSFSIAFILVREIVIAIQRKNQRN